MIKSTFAAFFFLGLVVAPNSALAQTRWAGDEECVEPERVEEELQRLRPDSAALNVLVHIERTPLGVVARVSRGSLARVLEAPSCEQLEGSLVLVLSLFPAVEDPPVALSERTTENAVALETPPAVGSNEVLAGDEPIEADPANEADPAHEADAVDESDAPDETDTPEEPDAPALDENEQAGETPPRSRLPLATWVGVGLDFNVGTLNGPSFAPSLTLAVERKRLWVALSGVYRPSLVRQYDTGEVSMSSAQGGLSVGGYAWKSEGERAGFMLSGGTSLGLITAESRNISQPSEGRALLWTLNADAHLHWSPWPWLRLRFQAGVGVPLIRAEYRIQGLGTLYTTPNLLVRAGISLELRFWARNSP